MCLIAREDVGLVHSEPALDPCVPFYLAFVEQNPSECLNELCAVIVCPGAKCCSFQTKKELEGKIFPVLTHTGLF